MFRIRCRFKRLYTLLFKLSPVSLLKLIVSDVVVSLQFNSVNGPRLVRLDAFIPGPSVLLLKTTAPFNLYLPFSALRFKLLGSISIPLFLGLLFVIVVYFPAAMLANVNFATSLFLVLLLKTQFNILEVIIDELKLSV